MDKVFIEALEIEALIGIYDWERRGHQPLLFDIEMAFDNRKPVIDNAHGLAVDYAHACELVRNTVQDRHYDSLELLAEIVATQLLERFVMVQAAEVCVRKPTAARALGAKGVGVSIRRERVTA